MAKFKRFTESTVVEDAKVLDGGRVYLYAIVLESGDTLYKVGMCSTDRVIDRMLEALRGFFTVYRYIPHTRLIKSKKSLVPRLVEKHLHRLLEEYSYRFDKKFSGSTEFFIGLDEDVLLEYINNFDDLDLFRYMSEMESKYYDILEKERNRRREGEEVDSLPF